MKSFELACWNAFAVHVVQLCACQHLLGDGLQFAFIKNKRGRKFITVVQTEILIRLTKYMMLKKVILCCKLGLFI